MSDLTVFFDHQIFDLQQVGGASRIYSELLSRLEGGFEGQLGVQASRNLYLIDHHGVPRASEASRESRISRLRCFAFRMVGANVPTRVVDNLPMANREFGLDLIERKRPDLHVPTYYDPYLLTLKHRPPVIATVLDMIPERFPEFYLGDSRHSVWKRKMVEGCEHIVAISRETKEDLIRIWGVPEEKIHVVPLASSFVEDDGSVVGPRPIPEPYLLFVGERRRYKNFYFLLESMRRFFIRNSEWKLLCVGAEFDRSEIQFLDALGLGDRVVTLSGNDRVVKDAYTHSACVVVPSQAEGFGLPVIEALALGCRVAASRIPVFQEIAGDRVAYFDPKDPVELAKVVETECLKGEDSEETMNARRSFARKYSWDATSRGYEEVFRFALS